VIEIIWDQRFKRIYRKWIIKHPDLVNSFKDRIVLFADDPFHPSLKTHPLSGILKGLWSLSLSREHRLIFKAIPLLP